MLSKVKSSALTGIEGVIVDVEVDISNGMSTFDIVGLPDSSVKESKERVRTAIKNSNYKFPQNKIMVNLAPADIKKEGVYFDLPIAIGILCCSNKIDSKSLDDTLIIGELSLDGNIRGVSGVLPIVMTAKEKGFKRVIVPKDNQIEASYVSGIDVYGVVTLWECVAFLNGEHLEKININVEDLILNGKIYDNDFSDVKGQENVKRAAEIAAAGLHNLLIIGPPGTGKTMVAKRIPTILPDLCFEECLEITKIYSVAGLLENNNIITSRPFRTPHHTASNVAMVGGGRIPKPGEVSLAHNGVLFLDEFPEFNKSVLEELRQPLEDLQVTVSRINGTVTYPSDFMLVASMNPCPCGYYGYGDKCSCKPYEVTRYMNKISGPLLDRIDIHVEAANIEFDDLHNDSKPESSKEIKKRVLNAQEIQRKRYKNDKIRFNSQLTAPLIEKYCVLGENESNIIKNAFNSMNLSARAYHKILKISRTIADLEESDIIKVHHLAEALQLRNLDRDYIF